MKWWLLTFSIAMFILREEIPGSWWMILASLIMFLLLPSSKKKKRREKKEKNRKEEDLAVQKFEEYKNEVFNHLFGWEEHNGIVECKIKTDVIGETKYYLTFLREADWTTKYPSNKFPVHRYKHSFIIDVKEGNDSSYHTWAFKPLTPASGVIELFPKKRFCIGDVIARIDTRMTPEQLDDLLDKERIAAKIKEQYRIKQLEKIVRQELIESGELFGEQPKRPPIPREIVDAVYKRDGGRCVYCGATENLQLDHIIPFSKGGATSLENLQLLCQKCNIEKSNKIG